MSMPTNVTRAKHYSRMLNTGCKSCEILVSRLTSDGINTWLSSHGYKVDQSSDENGVWTTRLTSSNGSAFSATADRNYDSTKKAFIAVMCNKHAQIKDTDILF